MKVVKDILDEVVNEQSASRPSVLIRVHSFAKARKVERCVSTTCTPDIIKIPGFCEFTDLHLVG